MPYGGTYTDRILQRAGISSPTTVQVQLAQMASRQIDAGAWTFDQAVGEFRVQIGQLPRSEAGIPEQEGRIPAGSQPSSGGTSGGFEDDPLGNASDVQLILMQYGGLSALEAQQAIAENPITAAKYAQQLLEDAGVSGGGSSGRGSGAVGRTQFPSESRLENANAAQIEQELAAIAAGTSRFQPFQGGYFDPQTGEFFDPSDVGLGRFNADTSRLNATTQQQLAAHQTGPAFQEGIRQFDQNLALSALGEERAGKTAAANAEIGFGNLGVDRAEFIRSVLNSPSDTLARLYMQRGGTSPLAKIEMADLLNSFNRQASNISNSVSRFAPNAALKGAITPVPASRLPQITPNVPTVGAAGPVYTSKDPLSPNADPWGPEAQQRYQQGIADGSIDFVTQEEDVASHQQALGEAALQLAAGGDTNVENWEKVAQEYQNRGYDIPGFPTGGYTQESRFIVGDQRSGKPTGHEELIVNPTNAPIQVVANRDLPNVSRFDEGTGSYGDIRPKVLDAQPTGGFLNSLKEALGPVQDLRNATREKIDSVLPEWTQDPTFQMAFTDAANPMHGGGASVGMVDDASRFFKKMTTAEKLAMAEKKGLSVEHIPLVDRLQAQYEKARQEVIDLVDTKASQADLSKNKPRVDAARAKAKELSSLLDEEKAKAREGAQTVQEAMMDDYSNTLKQYKLISKHADNVVERQTGGMFKTFAEFDNYHQELAQQVSTQRNLPPEKVQELQTLLKLDNHKTIKALRDLDNQLNTVGQQMGAMRSGKGDVNIIKEGISTEDSIRKALSGDAGLTSHNGPVDAAISNLSPIEARNKLQSMLSDEGWIGYKQRIQELLEDLPSYANGTSRFKRYADGTLFPTYNDTHSLFPTGDVTQQQLVDMSRIGTGPGGNSVLSGQMPSRFRIPGLQTPTAMQFSSLSGAERENLRPRLAAEFNSTLEDLMFDIEQRYSTGPSRMAKFRG